MSSPNEPGYPRTGDGNGNGSVPGPGGQISDSGDVPPWQRGPAARAANPARRQPEPRRGQSAPSPEGQGDDAARGLGSSAGHAPNVDARLNRFLAGGAASAPAEDVPPRGERTDAPRPDPRLDAGRPEAYASELPDLSGPTPRPPQRKPTTERNAPERPNAVEPTPAPRPAAAATRAPGASRHQGPVRASMQVRRVDPWSVLKISSVLSVALFFVWMIAVAFLYLVLGGMGVWSKLNSNVGDLLTSASGSAGGELVSSGTIFGGAALIGLVNIVLLTAMATVGAFIYNLTTDLVGGVEVTLADRD